MRESVSKFLEDSPFDEDLWKSFAQGLFYMPGDVADQTTLSTACRFSEGS